MRWAAVSTTSWHRSLLLLLLYYSPAKSWVLQMSSSRSLPPRAAGKRPSWGGCRKRRRCSRDTYPESHITKCNSIRRNRCTFNNSFRGESCFESCPFWTETQSKSVYSYFPFFHVAWLRTYRNFRGVRDHPHCKCYNKLVRTISSWKFSKRTISSHFRMMNAVLE